MKDKKSSSRSWNCSELVYAFRNTWRSIGTYDTLNRLSKDLLALLRNSRSQLHWKCSVLSLALIFPTSCSTEHRDVRSLHNAATRSGITKGIVNEMIVKASSAICHLARLPPLPRVIAPYITFAWQLVRLTEFSLRVRRFAAIMQSNSIQDFSRCLSCVDRVVAGAYDTTSLHDRAFCYVTCALFPMLHDEIGNTVLN